MPKSVNRVILLGHVGKDPEIKFSASGIAIANLSLATSERFKDKAGEWQDKSEWHNLVAFQRTAEIIRDYVRKGSQLYLEGRLQTSSWEDKGSGQKRYKTEIVIDNLIMLDGKKERGGLASPASENSYSAEITDDDIPF